jgi:hypothetical protein
MALVDELDVHLTGEMIDAMHVTFAMLGVMGPLVGLPKDEVVDAVRRQLCFAVHGANPCEGITFG